MLLKGTNHGERVGNHFMTPTAWAVATKSASTRTKVFQERGDRKARCLVIWQYRVGLCQLTHGASLFTVKNRKDYLLGCNWSSPELRRAAPLLLKSCSLSIVFHCFFLYPQPSWKKIIQTHIHMHARVHR